MRARFLLLGLALAACADTEPADARPNIVLILADDLGWADVGYQGSTFYRTPHIDALSARGLTFSNAYAPSAVCSPSRAAILTGLSPARLQITRALGGAPSTEPSGPATTGPANKRVWEPIARESIPAGTPTCASVLRAVGYRTALIGKWHLGGDPRDLGFDVVIGAGREGATPSYFAPYGLPGLEDAPPGEYLTDRLTDEALEFLRASSGAPFFLYLSHFAPHSPFEAKADVVERYAARVDPNGAQRNPVYAAMVESLDDSVGRIVAELDALGLTERTLLVFTSDNGGWVERRGADGEEPYHVTSNAPLRSGKGRLYEGGVRVPTIASGAGVRAGTTDEPILGTDFLATFTRAAGIALPKTDGVALNDLFATHEPLARDELVFHFPHQSLASSIRAGDHKLIHFYIRDRDELFDLSADVGEEHDLAATNSKLAADLRVRLESTLDAEGAVRPTRNDGRSE